MKVSTTAVLILLIIGIFIVNVGVLYSDNTKKISKSQNPFVTVSGNKFYLYGRPFIPKVVTYYPRDYGWSRMWDNFWNIQHIIDEDMKRARDLGVNVVRVLVIYPSLNGSSPNEWDLKKLDRFLEIADKYNIRVLFTLFDWTEPKLSYLQEHIQHLRTIVGRFKDDPRVFGWDLKYELDMFYYYLKTVPKSEALQWARTLISELKSIDSNHPVCVSERGLFLGDVYTTPQVAVYDDFEDGDYNGWVVWSPFWYVYYGYLRSQGDYLGAEIYHGDRRWWSKSGFTLKVNALTIDYSAGERDCGWIYFRFDPYNEPYTYRTYAILITMSGHLELWKIIDYDWYLLERKYIGLSPLNLHQFKIVNFMNEIEIYIDGVKYLYYWDQNPLTYGGIGFRGPYTLAADAFFDNVEVILGPSIIDENIHKNCDFILLHTYWDDADGLKTRIEALSSINKPVILVMGRPTAGVDNNNNPVPFDENSVAEWLTRCLNEIKRYDFVFPAIQWLLDFSQDGLWWLPPNHMDRYYGLYRLDYTLKPHGAVYRDLFQGTILNNNAEIVSASHPIAVNCNSTHIVSIKLRNTGDTIWSEQRGYRLGSVEPRDNTIWKVHRVFMGSAIVHPNGEHEFIFSITAPEVPGKYSFSWRMVRELVEWFGTPYRSTIKVRDPNLTEIIDDEFVDLTNWTVLQGQASTSQSHLIIQSGGCVVSRTKCSDITISYRGYSSSAFGWQRSIVFAKIYRTLNNYLGFTIYGNGYAEIFYVYNGTLYSNLSGIQTNINPNEYHTYFITISGKYMKVYVDGSLILSADISSYPHYNSVSYVGFYSPTATSYLDHAAIYYISVREISLTFISYTILTLSALVITLMLRSIKNGRSDPRELNKY